MELLSYHNDPAIKEKYLDRVIGHAKADEIIKGKYWEGGKGCAVGCTVHSSDHNAYESELGLPTWLAQLEDRIFEGLPNDEAKAFPQEFLEAIPVGKNLDRVRWNFLAFLMRELIERVPSYKISEDRKVRTLSVLGGSLAVLENALLTGAVDKKAAEKAYAAADADAAAAAYAASAAAGTDARKNAYSRYKTELLRLLREA